MPDAGQDISVCLLTYNHGHMIAETLRSVLDQSLGDYEVIVSDDCSTDDTWAKLQEIARHDDRVRLIRTPRNLGMAENANFAVSHSKRPYIALLHHDDIYRRDLLEKWVVVVAKYPDVGFVFNSYHFESYTACEAIEGDRVDGSRFLRQELLKRWDCPVRGTAMIRRSAWLEVGGMRGRFHLLADVDLWMRLARIMSVGYVAEPVISVRHDRPEDYPAEYKEQKWSWDRQRLLYEIHADNWRSVAGDGRLASWLGWHRFIIRVNLETAKWLTYGVVRRKPEMIAESDGGATDYDLLPLRCYRAILQWRATKLARS